MHLVKNLVNNGKIDQRCIVPGDAVSFRFGAFAGAGYEFYAIDLNHRFRVNMEPYVTVHAGTNVYNNYSSSLNSVFVRAGFSIKIGPDDIKYDTLKFDPNYKLEPVIVAKARENEVHFPGFQKPELVAALLEQPPKFVPLPLPVDTQKVVSIDVTPPKKIDSEQPAPEPGKFKLVMQPRQKQIDKIFNSFRRPEDVRLTKDMRDYLDAVADFMREHPHAEVRIVGHSDKFGTLEQNTERSKKRAEEAKRYLMSKGISSGRIFERGVGSTAPLINNERPGGASKNRRVEITVVGK
jgi:outer membrane protein OmpA-like peptidoglycan-associated protein